MDKISGFTIRRKGNRYYGVKRVGEKVVWVSLGESLEGAENKIVAYCLGKGIDTTKKTHGKASHDLTENVRSLTEKVGLLEAKLEMLDAENQGLRSRLEKIERNLGQGQPMPAQPTAREESATTTATAPTKAKAKRPDTAKRSAPIKGLEDAIARAKELHTAGKTWHDIRGLLHLSRDRKEWTEPIREALGL